jgi:hypothetical protein
MALSTSCKTAGSLCIQPVFTVLSVPLTNPDLLNLQGALFYYRQISSKWPGEKVDLVKMSKNDSSNVDFLKFTALRWSSVNDSLLVEYNLQYDKGDTLAYRYLSGKFYVLPNADTLQVIHVDLRGESKDGKLRFGPEPSLPGRKNK